MQENTVVHLVQELFLLICALFSDDLTRPTQIT
jgi:hypothetical protein